MNEFKAYCKMQTNDRIKRNTDVKRRDFYSYLLDAKDPETGLSFSHAELASEAGVLLVAGQQ